MAAILLLYATTDGHTEKICSRLQHLLHQDNNQVTVHNICKGRPLQLEAFDIIVLGSSIRYGKHHKHMHSFIQDNLEVLNKKSNAFFSVNLVARKQEKSEPATNPSMQKFLKQSAWKPQQLAVFAGKLVYAQYPFWDRWMIRLIMWMTKGPTDFALAVEYTDWDKVDQFGSVIKGISQHYAPKNT